MIVQEGRRGVPLNLHLLLGAPLLTLRHSLYLRESPTS